MSVYVARIHLPYAEAWAAQVTVECSASRLSGVLADDAAGIDMGQAVCWGIRVSCPSVQLVDSMQYPDRSSHEPSNSSESDGRCQNATLALSAHPRGTELDVL